MAVRSGFFNSVDFDRMYFMTEIAALFDGLITDGVYASIGTAMTPTVGSIINYVNIGEGRAWFNSTYTLVDAEEPVDCETSDALLNRIDMIVIDIDKRDATRDNTVILLKGVPATSPVPPTLADELLHKQKALCSIYRAAGSTEIQQADITNLVGSTETPFVTGIVETLDLETFTAQWQAELDELVDTETTNIADWIAAKTIEMNDWFNNMKDQLTEDAAIHLQNQIGILTNLLTDNKTDLVQAINEVVMAVIRTTDFNDIDANNCITSGRQYRMDWINTPKTSGLLTNINMATDINEQSFIDLNGMKWKRFYISSSWSTWSRDSNHNVDVLIPSTDVWTDGGGYFYIEKSITGILQSEGLFTGYIKSASRTEITDDEKTASSNIIEFSASTTSPDLVVIKMIEEPTIDLTFIIELR